MRKIASVVLAGGLLAGAAVTSVRADEAAPDKPGAAERHEGWGRKGGLGLSDEQKDKLGDLRDAAAETMLPLKIKERKILRALRKQLRDKASDADLSATLDQLKAARAEASAARRAARDKAAEVFTPQQRAKLVLMMAMRQRMRRAGFGGPGMMMRGPGGPGMMWRHRPEGPKGPKDDDDDGPGEGGEK